MKRKLKRKIWFALLTIVVVLALILALVTLRLGTVIRTAVNTLGPSILKVPVNVESVAVYPLRGTFKLKSLTIGNPAGYSSDYLFHLDEMSLKLVMSELLHGNIHFTEIIISGPHVWYDRKLKSSNVSDLLALLESDEPKETKPKESGDDKPKKAVIIDYFEMKSGKVGVKLGVGMNIPLPALELKNIGRDKSLMPAQVIRLIFVNIFRGVLNVVASVGEFAIDGVKEVGSLAVDGVKGAGSLAVDGVKGAGKVVGGVVTGLFGGSKTNEAAASKTK